MAAAFVAQSGIRLSPDSLGVAGEFQRAILGTWQLNVGAEVGLHQDRTLLQPYAVMQRDITRFGAFDLYWGGGVAVPIQFMSDTTAGAVAVRGLFGTRWRWNASRRVVPHAHVVLVAGPIVSPGNVAPDPYIAGQFVIGASFDLGNVHES